MELGRTWRPLPSRFVAGIAIVAVLQVRSDNSDHGEVTAQLGYPRTSTPPAPASPHLLPPPQLPAAVHLADPPPPPPPPKFRLLASSHPSCCRQQSQ